jgi:hypothetical protein
MNSNKSYPKPAFRLVLENMRQAINSSGLIPLVGRVFGRLLNGLKSDATAIVGALDWSAQPIQGRCVLPIPVQKQAPAAVKKEKKPTSVFDIDVQYNDRGNPVSGTFGFYTASLEADRKGAVRHCTGYDIQELEGRGLSGGKKVQAQNERCKALWFSGETVAGAMAEMKLSDSWIEKRFAAFSAALSAELSK